MALGVTRLCRYAERHYAHCLNLFIVMLNVVMLSGIMLSVIMLCFRLATIATCTQGPLKYFVFCDHSYLKINMPNFL